MEDGHETAELDPNKLGFLLLAEWDEYNSYDEDIPSRLRYKKRSVVIACSSTGQHSTP